MLIDFQMSWNIDIFQAVAIGAYSLMFIVGLPSNAILLYFLFTAKVSVVEDEEHDEDEEGDY